MKVTCIKCWDAQQVVTLDLDGSNLFRCMGCNDEFTPDDVQEIIDAAARWRKVLAWIDAAPVEEEAPAA